MTYMIVAKIKRLNFYLQKYWDSGYIPEERKCVRESERTDDSFFENIIVEIKRTVQQFLI